MRILLKNILITIPNDYRRTHVVIEHWESIQIRAGRANNRWSGAIKNLTAPNTKFADFKKGFIQNKKQNETLLQSKRFKNKITIWSCRLGSLNFKVWGERRRLEYLTSLNLAVSGHFDAVRKLNFLLSFSKRIKMSFPPPSKKTDYMCRCREFCSGDDDDERAGKRSRTRVLGRRAGSIAKRNRSTAEELRRQTAWAPQPPPPPRPNNTYRAYVQL